MPAAVIRCAIYTRQSVRTETDLSSCQTQYEACLELIKSRKSLGWKCIEERFDDEGYSGATADRPALNRLTQKIAKGEVDHVVVYRLDRLSRNILDTLSLLDSFRQKRIGFAIVTMPDLSGAATDIFLLNILSSFAEFEREIIRERIAEARAYLKRHGRRVAGALPFGYVSDPYTKQLAVEPNEVGKVRYMFYIAADANTPSQIAAAMNKRGWITKVRVGARTLKRTGGNPWTPRQVLATLTNPVYIGKIRDGERLRPGVHKAVVDEELFKDVQIAIRRRRTLKFKSLSLVWPFQGLIVCARCGRPMSPHEVHYRRRIYCYYKCRSNSRGRPPCKGVIIGVTELDQRVFDAMEQQQCVVSKFDMAISIFRYIEMTRSKQKEVIKQILKEVRYSARKISVTFCEDAAAHILEHSVR